MENLLPAVELQIFNEVKEKKVPLNFFLLLRKIKREGIRSIANLHEYTPGDKIVSVFDFVHKKSLDKSANDLYKLIGVPFEMKDIFFIFHRGNPQVPFETIRNYAKKINFRQSFVYNKNDFTIEYTNWNDDLQKTVERDIETVERKIKMFDQLGKIPSDFLRNDSTSEIKETSSGVKFSLRLPDDINRLPDIFAKCKSNIEVPYIQYNDTDGKQFYKIFRSKSKDTQPSYNVSVPQSTFNGNNKIFMYIWKTVTPFKGRSELLKQFRMLIKQIS